MHERSVCEQRWWFTSGPRTPRDLLFFLNDTRAAEHWAVVTSSISGSGPNSGHHLLHITLQLAQLNNIEPCTNGSYQQCHELLQTVVSSTIPSGNCSNPTGGKGGCGRGHGVVELPLFTAALIVLRDHLANTYLPAHEWIGRLLISECNRRVCFWCCHCNSYSNSNWQNKEIWVRAKGRCWSQDEWVTGRVQ